MERCKPIIGQEKTKNEKQANDARQKAGELLSHSPGKITFVAQNLSHGRLTDVETKQCSSEQ